MNRKTLRNGVFTTVFSLVLAALVVFNILTSDIGRRRSETSVLLQHQAATIERNFVTVIERVYALRAFIIGSGGNYDNLDPVAEYILKGPDVRNVLIAPNSVVDKVLPLAGNEAVLGMDLTGAANKSREDAIAAIQSKEPVFSGPYNLAQGGQAISLRLAVYLEEASKADRYWGLLSISVNYPDVIGNLATNYIVDSGYEYILFKKDPLTGEYQRISEHLESEKNDFVTHDFSIQNLEFRFCALPRNGFVDMGKVFLFVAMGVFLSITLGVVVSAVSFLMSSLAERAGRDTLTGLLNREGGVRHIEGRIKEGQFKNGAFVLMDVDHFKSVNDTMGHPKGDEVLIETASLLKGLCRSMDIVCRLGGDEFVVFFSYDGDSSFVLGKAENIRATMQRTVSSEEHSVNVSASLGVSFVVAGEKSFEKLYKESDIALYDSKQRGKNTVTVYEAPRASEGTA